MATLIMAGFFKEMIFAILIASSSGHPDVDTLTSNRPASLDWNQMPVLVERAGSNDKMSFVADLKTKFFPNTSYPLILCVLLL